MCPMSSSPCCLGVAGQVTRLRTAIQSAARICGADRVGGSPEVLLASLGVDEKPTPVASRRKEHRLVERQLVVTHVHPPPTVAAETFERPEARLVSHPIGAIDPIAEIDVRQPGAG